MFRIDSHRISGIDVLPLVEGGKGISISNGATCGAWASAGCVGTFSAVNADSYDENGQIIHQIYQSKSRSERQREMIEFSVAGGITQAKIAKETASGRGRIHMNILWEMGGSEEIADRILCEVSNCIDGVICGAGMPYKLAEIASKHGVYYYPIVSSSRAFSTLYRRSYNRFPDLLGGIVYEDPWLAGGHNGLSNAESPKNPINPYLRIVELRKVMNSFGLINVPIIIAGGVWWLNEWEDYINNTEVGPVAFQFGTRPILTTESPVANAWHNRLMSLKKGDVKLTSLSPTGFYSSAVANKMLIDLLGINERQVQIVEKSDVVVECGLKSFCADETKKSAINIWINTGFSVPLYTPDNTLVFVTPLQAQHITEDQKNCCGCLSSCRFSSWNQENMTTGKRPDPRTFCIQKNLQNIAHDGNIEENLLFAGHAAYRFAEDPFYANEFIPSTKQLIDRILTGY